jgi:hypothetical protein
MTFLDRNETNLLRDLQVAISNAGFDDLGRGFRRRIDMQIVSGLYGLVTSCVTRDAAAELARDCGALAEDLALAGAHPSAAWEEMIEDDRKRARISLQRLTESLATCVQLDPKTGRQRLRPASVPMRRKSFYNSKP